MTELICDADGIRLPPDFVLAERRGAAVVPHHAHEIFRRLAPRFGVDLGWARLNFAVGRAARHLTAGQIAAARKAVEAVRLPQPLAKFNPNHYGPGLRGGQFAPPADGGTLSTPGRATPSQVAQDERDNAEEDDAIDPTASVRQALWNSSIRALREVDPNNPALTYFANPNSPPSQAALDRLNDALGESIQRRVLARLMPGHVAIGRSGSRAYIRELPGGLDGAQRMFDDLRVGGIVHREADGLTVVRFPGDRHITFRPASSDGSPAIDVNFPGLQFRLHFRGD